MPIDLSSQQLNSLGTKLFNNDNIVKSGLVVYLDATISDSYPGTGTVWYDLSGNGNNFNIVATAFNKTNQGYMDFNGSYGCAKNSTDLSISGNITYVVWTRIKNSTAEWRTLTRGYGGDHNVIILSGGWEIGMYDNDSAGFMGTGYSQQSLPNYGTSNWICMYWRWRTSSPYYQMSFNDTPSTIRGSLTSSNAYHTRGFGSIGAYHNGNTDPSSVSQPWGDIGLFMCYNRVLTDSELLQNYNATRSKFAY
jgi:hypothetical protein